MRELRCGDAGLDCDEVLKGEDDDEVMSKTAAHAREVHGIDEIDDGLGQKLRALIRDA